MDERKIFHGQCINLTKEILKLRVFYCVLLAVEKKTLCAQVTHVP